MRAACCEATVLSHESILPDIRLLRALWPDREHAPHAGQFFTLRAWGADEAPFLSRPISVHKWEPETQTIEFLYQVIGEGTHKIAQLKTGDTFQLTGPMGNGFDIPALAEKYHKIAVVGGGIGTAPMYQVTRELAAAGVQVISGMALGIDGAGHEGALAGGGKTYAVLGCGVDQCYPRSNYELYESIPFHGGLISEYSLKTPPVPRNFPVRNRIISGLSDVILVIEAKEKSGSLITAQAGLEQGKEIYALPGRITDALSTGCNQLISEGAQVLFSPETVLENLGIFVKEKEKLSEKKQKGLAKKEKMVYSCLDFEPRHIEEIALRTGLSVSQSMDALLELELGGYAVRTAGLYYTKRLF